MCDVSILSKQLYEANVKHSVSYSITKNGKYASIVLRPKNISFDIIDKNVMSARTGFFIINGIKVDGRYVYKRHLPISTLYNPFYTIMDVYNAFAKNFAVLKSVLNIPDPILDIINVYHFLHYNGTTDV